MTPGRRRCARGLPVVLAITGLAARAGAQDLVPPGGGTVAASVGPLAVSDAEVGLRYRSNRDSGGEETIDGMEALVRVAGAVAIAPANRVQIGFGVYTGNAFASGWNSTGIGTGRGSAALFVKQLYAVVRPTDHLVLEYGSLYPIPSRHTAVVGYDNDGYFGGERIRLESLAPLVDTIAITCAHAGDFGTPQFTSRLHSLVEPNFYQVYVDRRVRRRWFASVDQTVGPGTNATRLAVTLRALTGLSVLRVELYKQLHGATSIGVHARRSLGRLTLAGGYGNLDARDSRLTGTEFFDGQRWYGDVAVRVGRGRIGAFWTEAFGNDRPIAAAREFELRFLIDLLP